MESEQRLFRSIKAGDKASVQGLVNENPSLVDAWDENGLSAVLMALYYQKPDIADWLVGKGANLDIFEACACGQPERVVELLNSEPGQVNAVAGDGFQPLGLACFFGRLEVAEILLSHGASVNVASQNPLKVMPLHSAVAGQHLEITRALLHAGADVNAYQADNFTPLHGAAQNGQLEMVRLLFQYGAFPNPQNAAGKTPLSFALEGGHTAAANLIRQQGGKI